MYKIHEYELRVREHRSENLPASLGRKASGAVEAAAVMRELIENAAREEFWVVALNSKNKIIGAYLVSAGSLTSTIVHPREVFRIAIHLGAAAVIVCHNHPSGESDPSSEDRATTKRLKEGGALLGIPVLDHIILGACGSWYSFAQSDWN
jgi:DNA repair protein RadC